MHPLWCTAGEGEGFGLELHWGGGRVEMGAHTWEEDGLHGYST